MENLGPLTIPMKTQQKNIYFSPHLDDVVFSCAGTMHAQTSRAESVTVVTIFSGTPRKDSLSALARMRHETMWPDTGDVIAARRLEDQKSLSFLGVQHQRWDYLECIYRCSSDGKPLYESLKDIYRDVPDKELPLQHEILDKCRALVGPETTEKSRLFFPMSIGNHMDHRMIFNVGKAMAQDGHSVLFYEDVPYAWNKKSWKELLGYPHREQEWKAHVFASDIEIKIKAAQMYPIGLSAFPRSKKGLFNSMRTYAASVAQPGGWAERFWEYRGKLDR